jgi:PAS domain S-box-containing protein
VARPAVPAGDSNTLPDNSNPVALRESIVRKDHALNEARNKLRTLEKKLEIAQTELTRVRTQMQTSEDISDNQLTKQDKAQEAAQKIIQIDTELEMRQALFRGLVASSPDHIFVLTVSGTYLFSNDCVQQFNLERGYELIGKRLQDVYTRDGLSQYREKLQQVIRDRQVLEFHHQKSTPKGQEYHIDTLYPIYQGKDIWAIGGICRNISEQKAIEKQLFQAQKMEAIGTLVAGVAHEINNPINLILFNLPLFEKMWQDLLPILNAHSSKAPDKKIGGLPPDFVKQNLPRLISDMEMAANRVAQIINGLKGFARKSNPAEKSNVPVNTAVQNAVRLADATVKKSKTIMELDLAADLPLISANLQNLEQIVLNLIINALESIRHNHGKVRISTKLLHKDKTIAIQVCDNGRGINPKVAEKIFDPFVTDRQAVGGTGLGLSVSYNLVKSHKGDIIFKTVAGQGTTFTVTLPVEDKRKPFKIMVVDDDLDFRELIIRAISREFDCVVEDFANGAEALIRMGNYPPDLLILDMFMPEMDGLGVCRAIKNELGLERMKVIIVTGFPDHPNLYEASRMGFTQILTKPLAIEDFKRTVRENLDGKSSRKIINPDR